ncbi:MAG: Y-family DNA polymerase [Rickettsiales bacterium]
MHPLRFLFIDFNSYFASVEQQLKPDLRGEPVIVVPVMTDATCAIAASYEAKALGIKTGTPVYEAKRLCKNLNIVEANHEHYVRFHDMLHEIVHRVIPVSYVASIDEFGCELMGDEREEEKAINIAGRIKDAIRHEAGKYIRCSIGIAPNRYLAKVACDIQKPDGLTVIRHADIPSKLISLAPRDLPGIGYNMEQRLLQHGIRSFDDIWKLEPKHMRKIWHSVAGEQLYYRLRGVEIPDAPTQTSTVGHSHVLAPEWRPIEAAHIVAQRLVLKAASRLRRKAYHARFLDLSVRIENGARIAYRAEFPLAADSMQFMRALECLWRQLLEEMRPARLKKISVTLHGLQADTAIQPTLFDAMEAGNPQRAKRLEEASRAMDRLNAKFGRDTVAMGFLPKTSSQFSGTKIAFSRVPELAEFHE